MAAGGYLLPSESCQPLFLTAPICFYKYITPIDSTSVLQHVENLFAQQRLSTSLSQVVFGVCLYDVCVAIPRFRAAALPRRVPALALPLHCALPRRAPVLSSRVCLPARPRSRERALGARGKARSPRAPLALPSRSPRAPLALPRAPSALSRALSRAISRALARSRARHALSRVLAPPPRPLALFALSRALAPSRLCAPLRAPARP